MDEIAEALAHMRFQAQPDGTQPDRGPTDQATSMAQQAHLDEVLDAELDTQLGLDENRGDHLEVPACPPVTQMCTSDLVQMFSCPTVSCSTG